jgi:hypothetical protein
MAAAASRSAAADNCWRICVTVIDGFGSGESGRSGGTGGDLVQTNSLAPGLDKTGSREIGLRVKGRHGGISPQSIRPSSFRQPVRRYFRGRRLPTQQL